MTEEDEAIKLMYGALLQVSFVAFEHFGSECTEMGVVRMKRIAEDALRRMNSEHTALVQEAMGIGGRR